MFDSCFSAFGSRRRKGKFQRPAKARFQAGTLQHRDEVHCTIARYLNSHLMADLADGRLVPDIGWQPMTAELKASCSAHPGAAGRLVALVPPFARAPWNQDANRRPFFPVDKNARRFFHLPPRAD